MTMGKLPGKCTRCDRLRNIRVEGRWSQVGVARGICQECDDAADIEEAHAENRANDWRYDRD